MQAFEPMRIDPLSPMVAELQAGLTQERLAAQSEGQAFKPMFNRGQAELRRLDAGTPHNLSRLVA